MPWVRPEEFFKNMKYQGSLKVFDTIHYNDIF